MKRNWIVRGVKIAVLAVVAFAAFTFLVMALWNWLMPQIFGWQRISFWQALGLLVLSKILFGGFRGGGHRGHWPRRMRERWEQMTPEQREKLRKGLMCGCRTSDPADMAGSGATQTAER
jgi:hypothetical protein